MNRRLAAVGASAALLLTPLAITVAGAGPAAAAGSDSLVYLKGGRVWIARGDGTGARPFTTAAYNWSSPSEDDNGNVVVVGGLARVNADGTDSGGSSEIYRFAPNGNQIGRPIPTWGSYSTPACPTYGPFSARVSPDGSKVAYGIWDCGSFSDTALWTPVTSTGLNFPNQTLGQEDFYEPQWVDNTQFMVSHAGPTVTDTQSRFFVHRLNAGDDVGPGWTDPAFTGTGVQALVSRQQTTLAAFEDDAADYIDGKPRHVRLFLYSSPSLAAAATNGWNLNCTITLDAAHTSDPLHLSPSFSTDGTKLYWGDDRGVEVAQISDRSGSCGKVHPSVLVPGGSQPFVSSGGIHAPAAEPVQPGAHYPPHARYTFTPARPRAHRAVTLDARSSYETLGQISGYRWRFGDGKTATGRTVKHTFTRPGTYKVRLMVTDKRGTSGSVTHTIKVGR
jgi:PKD domain